MKILIAFLILAIPLSASSQNQVTGVVQDETGKPLNYATVYINGTTKGTYTDINGHFILENISIPSQLAVSHIGYGTQTFEITQQGTSSFNIRLRTKDISLEEITITAIKINREESLKLFKEYFFGTDKHGKSTIIKNDSVLAFGIKKEKEMHQGIEQEKSTFTAITTAPLIVEMPSLGYVLHIDLVDFSVTETTLGSSKTSHLGYFYYKPMEITSKKKRAGIEKERKKVYYNSGLHFCRSLYNGTLLQNGYLIVQSSYSNEEKKYFHEIIDHIHSIKNKNGQMIIEGLNDEQFSIYYYSKKNGPPFDLNKDIIKNTFSKTYSEMMQEYIAKKDLSSASFVRFSADTCIINPSGTIPDNNIIFGGYIGKNKAGMLLPDDYEPEE